MHCRGCAAKVPAEALHEALAALPDTAQNSAFESNPLCSSPRAGSPTSSAHAVFEEVLELVGARDDAAVLPAPPAGHSMLQTVDFLSACTDDLYLFGRIAAVHAMSDCFAMGAQPTSAVATAEVSSSLRAVQHRSCIALTRERGIPSGSSKQ